MLRRRDEASCVKFFEPSTDPAEGLGVLLLFRLIEEAVPAFFRPDRRVRIVRAPGRLDVLGGLQVGGHHLADQFGEGGARHPAELLAGLGFGSLHALQIDLVGELAHRKPRGEDEVEKRPVACGVRRFHAEQTERFGPPSEGWRRHRDRGCRNGCPASACAREPCRRARWGRGGDA